jgi:PAS domain S-box-containing protein
MSASLIARLRYLGTLWLLGAAALALATFVCFRLDVGFEAASFTLLILIVLLSLLDSLISSLIFSFLAVVLLDYYFVHPRFTLFVFEEQDYWALGTLVVASVVITTLVRRLRQHADKLRVQSQMLDLTHDTVFVHDSNGAITYWNHGAEKLYGWKSEEVIGKVSHDLLQTLFPVPLEQILRELSVAGRWEGELVHTKRDGSKATVASRWSLQKDEGGRRIGTLETNNDITERKRAEEALNRVQAAYLTEAQRLSATGSFGWNVATGEIYWSEETCRIMGHEPAVPPTIDLLNQRIHPDDAPLVHGAMERATNSYREIDIEHRVLMPDGAIKHVHVVAHPLADEPAQFVGAVMDITARIDAQETLRRVQADFAHAARVSALGELTASIAHEVSQPLTAISTDASAVLLWLNRAEPDVAEAKAHTAHIVAAAARAGEVIMRVRGMAARQTPQATVLAINGVVEDAMAFLRQELRANQVTVTLDLAQNLPAVLADVTQLQQVVVNLAMNAVQAMAQTDHVQRQLIVRSSRDGEAVKITLDDTGPGISADQLSRLFERFFTTKDGGMGIGLAICRSIIESYGGRIDAGNRAEGGAQFTFTLPIARDPGALAP